MAKRLQGEIVVVEAREYMYGGFGPYPRGTEARSSSTMAATSGRFELVRRGLWLVFRSNIEFGAPEKWWRETVTAPDRIEFTGKVNRSVVAELQASAAEYRQTRERYAAPDRHVWAGLGRRL